MTPRATVIRIAPFAPLALTVQFIVLGYLGREAFGRYTRIMRGSEFDLTLKARTCPLAQARRFAELLKAAGFEVRVHRATLDLPGAVEALGLRGARPALPPELAAFARPLPGTAAYTARALFEAGVMTGDEADAWKDACKDGF